MKISRYCDKIIVTMLVAVVIALPLFFDVSLYSVFDLSKVAVLLFSSTIIMAAWLIKIIFDEEFTFPHTEINLPVLFYLLFTSVAVVFSINPFMSLVGAYKRFDGLIEISSYIFIFFSVVAFINSVRRLNLLINSIVGSAVISSIYGFMQFFDKDPFHWSATTIDRIFSTFGNPVFYSAFLITSLPLSLALYFGCISFGRETPINKCVKKDIVYGLCTVVIYTIFWHTKTRADFVALIIYLPLFFIFMGKERISASKWKVIIIIVIFIGVGTFYCLRPQSSVFGYFAREISIVNDNNNVNRDSGEEERSNVADRSFLANRLKGSSFNRYYQFKTALKIYNEYPVIGLGPDTLGLLYQQFLKKVYTKFKEDGNWPRHDRIHNDILDNVVGKGALGLSAYLWFVMAYFWLVWKFLRKGKAAEKKQTVIRHNQMNIDKRLLVVGLGIAALGYLIQNEFSFGNTSIVTIFWVVIALTVVVIKDTFTDAGVRDAMIETDSILVKGGSIFTLRKALLSLLVIVFFSFLLIHFLLWYRADTFMEKGRRYIRNGYLEKGIGYYEDAIFYNPYEVNYRDMLINALFRAENVTKDAAWLESVIEVADKNLEIVPQHCLGVFAKANAYYMLDRNYGRKTLDLAIENYRKAIDLDPFQPQIYHHFSMACIRGDLFDEAAGSLKMARLFYPKNTAYINRLFRIYLQQNKLEELEVLFDEMTRLELEQTAPLTTAKGLYFAKTGKAEDAYNEFVKALEIDPENVQALDNVINFGIQLGKRGETVKYLLHAIKLIPAEISYRMNLAALYGQKGQLNKTIEVMNEIIRIDPGMQIECLDKLGTMYLNHNDFDNAIISFKKVIDLDPENAKAYNNLAAVYVQKGMNDDAILMLKKALEIEADSTIYLGNIGKIYLLQGMYDDLTETIDAIIKLDTDNEEAKMLLKRMDEATSGE